MKKFTSVILVASLLSSFFVNSFGQNQQGGNYLVERRKLNEFAWKKNQEWIANKHFIDSIFSAKDIERLKTDSTGLLIEVQKYIHNNPLYYTTNNAGAAQTISVNRARNVIINQVPVTGIGASALIWDGGAIRTDHQEFYANSTSRIMQRDDPGSTLDHSTHIAGTMIAAGMDALAKGMAPQGMVYGYDFNNDVSEIASEASDGSILSNHSYGTICGWRYDLIDELWYWHGDLSVSATEDPKFGFYDQIASDIDFILYNSPEYILVKSAGNDHDDGPEIQPVEHLVWDDDWVSSTDVRDIDGGSNGFDGLSSIAVAKNVITVGAVKDLSTGYNGTSDVVLEKYSSWGPTDDGRIKPDVVANGEGLYSSSAESTSSYLTYNGTSMAAASITGSVILLHQAQELLQPGVALKSATVKGLIIHTADEAGEHPGPDYKHGWGLTNINSALGILVNNAQNGGCFIIEDELSDNGLKAYPFYVNPGTDTLKITLCWTDPPATPQEYSLNPDGKMLVNDLDLRIINTTSGQEYFPWVLDPANPDLPASRSDNSRDNVEQIEILFPAEGNYELSVSHKSQLKNLKQPFSLLISGISCSGGIYPPSRLIYNSGNQEVTLLFGAAFGASVSYNIYRNDAIIANITDTVFKDSSVANQTTYSYFVTALYPDGNESLPTNRVFATPQKPLLIPYSMDFETLDNSWILKHSISGWRHGNSDSLNSYYLNFSANNGNFLAADSYTAGKGIHTWDYAISPTFDISNCTDVHISFDYLLWSGVYGAIDELHLVYKTAGGNEWIEIAELPVSQSWINEVIYLPSEVQGENIQFGLYYDDFYKWGFGAGIDNFIISGTCQPNTNIDIYPIEIDEPFTQCILGEDEVLTVAIKNVGTDALPADSEIELSVFVNNILKLTETFTTSENLFPDSVLDFSFSCGLDLSLAMEYSIVLIAECNWDMNSDNNTLARVITHLGNPEPTIEGLSPDYCLGIDSIPLKGVPEGGIFNGEGITDSTLFLKGLIAGETIINYAYTDFNMCTGDTNYSILLIAPPGVNFLNADTGICVNSDPFEVNFFPSGGLLSGEGVSGIFFYPVDDLIGENLIIYQLTDIHGCSNSDSLTITVKPLPEISIGIEKDPVCYSSDSVQIHYSPSGGVLYGTAVMDDHFFPPLATEARSTIFYEYLDLEGCCAMDSIIVTVLPRRNIAISPNDTILCEDNPAVLLSAEPSDGIFYGTAVSGSVFYPELAGSGIHTIYYSLPDACNRDSITLELTEAADVFFQVADTSICRNTGLVPLDVNPAGGTFSDQRITDYLLNPEFFEPGMHSLIYSYSNSSGCSNSDTLELTINTPLPAIILNRDTFYCNNSEALKLHGDPGGGVFSGEGVFENFLYPDLLKEGDHIYQYIIEDTAGCMDTAFHQFEIVQAPFLSLGGDTSISDTDTLFLSPETNGTYFEWFDGATEPIHNLYGNDFNLGENLVYLQVSNESGCSASDSIWMIVEQSVKRRNNIITTDEVLIYPNPFTDALRFQITDPTDLQSITLCDKSGRSLGYLSYKESSLINLRNLKPGVYMVVFRFTDKIYFRDVIKL